MRSKTPRGEAGARPPTVAPRPYTAAGSRGPGRTHPHRKLQQRSSSQIPRSPSALSRSERVQVWLDEKNINAVDERQNRLREADTLLQRGKSHFEQGNFEDALASFGEALRVQPKNNEALFQRGVTRLSQQNMKKAMEDFSALLERQPKHKYANIFMALCYKKSGDPRGAIRQLTRILELDPSFVDAVAARGELFLKNGDFENAIRDFSRVVALEPYGAVGHCGLGDAYFGFGDLEEALAHYNRAIKYDSKYEMSFVGRAKIMHEWGQVSAALEDLCMAISTRPTNDKALFQRACLYAHANESQKALEDFNAYIRIDGHCPDAYYRRGMIKFDSGEYSGAVHDFSMCLKLDKTHRNASIFKNLSQAVRVLKLDQFKKGLDLCDLAIADNKSIADSFIYRGYANYMLGNYDRALNDFSTAKELKPKDKRVVFGRLFELGARSCRVRDFGAALQPLSRCISTRPSAWEPRLFRAMVNVCLFLDTERRQAKSLPSDSSQKQKFADSACADLDRVIELMSQEEQEELATVGLQPHKEDGETTDAAGELKGGDGTTPSQDEKEKSPEKEPEGQNARLSEGAEDEVPKSDASAEGDRQPAEESHSGEKGSAGDDGVVHQDPQMNPSVDAFADSTVEKKGDSTPEQPAPEVDEEKAKQLMTAGALRFIDRNNSSMADLLSSPKDKKGGLKKRDSQSSLDGKAKKTSGSVIPALTAVEKREIRKAFAKYDPELCKRIKPFDLSKVLQKLGVVPSREIMLDAFSVLDPERKAEIELPAFMKWYARFRIVGVEVFEGSLDEKMMSMDGLQSTADPSAETKQSAVPKSWERRIRLHPDTAWATRATMHYFKGVFLQYQGLHEEALVAFEDCLDLDKSNADFFHSRGVSRMCTQKIKEAISDFSAAIDIEPGRCDSRTYRGKCYYFDNAVPKALKDHKEAVKLNPKNAVGAFHLGDLSLAVGKAKDAINNYTDAINLSFGKMYDGYYHRAKAYIMRGNFNLAEKDLVKTTELRPKHPLASFDKEGVAAITFCFKNEYARAIPLCSRLLYMAKTNELGRQAQFTAFQPSHLHWLRAVCHFYLGEMKKALLEFQASVANSPRENSVEYLFNVTLVHLALNNYEQALLSISKGVKAQPINAHFHFLRGLIHLELDRQADSKHDFMQCYRFGRDLVELFLNEQPISMEMRGRKINTFLGFDWCTISLCDRQIKVKPALMWVDQVDVDMYPTIDDAILRNLCSRHYPRRPDEPWHHKNV